MMQAARDQMIHRLNEAEGDEELLYALDRLRKNFYQLYLPVREYQEDPAVLEEWRRAEKPSQEWAKGFFFMEALKVLSFALDG